MSKYTEPTDEAFDAAEQTALDIMATTYKDLQTKAGSVIRELLIRPFAYLYAWCRTNLAAYRKQSTVAYLQTSQLTENPVADAVASNYFVTRRTGTRSKGVVTLVSTNPVIQLPAGSVFLADGVKLMTPYRTIATSGVQPGLVDDTMYVAITALGSNYAANIPVEVDQPGDIELNAGTPITMNFVYTGLVSAELTSPVTGGSGTETDAQLMRRAEYNTAASGVGSWYGIRKLLNDAPVYVADFGLLASEDAMLYRARYNTVNLNMGGVVDCYVKTQRQASTATVEAHIEQVSAGTYRVRFSGSSSVSGVYGVGNAYLAGARLAQRTVSYASLDPDMDARGARLSTKQETIVTFQSSAQDVTSMPFSMDVSYMPGLAALQQYVDLDRNTFIGQDLLIKAAVPVPVHLDCTAYSTSEITDEQLELLKSTLVDKVDSMPMGTGVLNFSDLRKAAAEAVPSVDLRLPCTMSVDVPLVSGGADSFYSNTGILDITKPVHVDAWDPAVCFFSLIPENIRIDTL